MSIRVTPSAGGVSFDDTNSALGAPSVQTALDTLVATRVKKTYNLPVRYTSAGGRFFVRLPTMALPDPAWLKFYWREDGYSEIPWSAITYAVSTAHSGNLYINDDTDTDQPVADQFFIDTNVANVDDRSEVRVEYTEGILPFQPRLYMQGWDFVTSQLWPMTSTYWTDTHPQTTWSQNYQKRYWAGQKLLIGVSQVGTAVDEPEYNEFYYHDTTDGKTYSVQMFLPNKIVFPDLGDDFFGNWIIEVWDAGKVTDIAWGQLKKPYQFSRYKGCYISGQCRLKNMTIPIKGRRPYTLLFRFRRLIDNAVTAWSPDVIDINNNRLVYGAAGSAIGVWKTVKVRS